MARAIERFLRAMLWMVFMLFACTASAAQTAPDGRPLAPGEHRFDSAGVELWYRVAGKTEGMPLVFLHGGPGEGSQAFQAVGGPELEKTQRLIYFDQRGAGRSQRPKQPEAYSIAIMVEDLERLRLQLGVPKIALLGHSWGTILALEYAARYPEHASALVLAAAVPDLVRQTELLCKAIEARDTEAYARATRGIAPGTTPPCNVFAAYPGGMKQFVYANMFPDPATGERVDALDNAGGLQNTGESSAALVGPGKLFEYRFAGAGRVTARVLVIAGGKDFQAVIEPQRALAAALAHGRVLEYSANGHFMFVEDPDRFARDVAAFLNESR